MLGTVKLQYTRYSWNTCPNCDHNCTTNILDYPCINCGWNENLNHYKWNRVKDTWIMTSYWKIYNTACEMIDEGIYPSPTKLNERLGHTDRRRMNMLNGEETFARRKALLDKGYFKGKNGRYGKP